MGLIRVSISCFMSVLLKKLFTFNGNRNTFRVEGFKLFNAPLSFLLQMCFGIAKWWSAQPRKV